MKKKINLLLLGLSIGSFAGMITTMIIYFINKSKVNGIEFIEVAANSVREAKEMLDFTETMGWMTIILMVLTLLLVAGTVVMFILRGKEKKEKNNGSAPIMEENIQETPDNIGVAGEEKRNESN